MHSTIRGRRWEGRGGDRGRDKRDAVQGKRQTDLWAIIHCEINVKATICLNSCAVCVCQSHAAYAHTVRRINYS